MPRRVALGKREVVTDSTTGAAMTVEEHAERLGVEVATLAQRIRRRGVNHPSTWTAGNLIDLGVAKRHRDPVTGIEATSREHASRLGIAEVTLRSRWLRLGKRNPLSWRKGNRNLHGRNVRLPGGGKARSMREASRRSDVPYATLRMRLDSGLTGERLWRDGHARALLLTHPVTGEEMTRKAWAKHIGIADATFYQRLKRRGAGDPAVFERFLTREPEDVKAARLERARERDEAEARREEEARQTLREFARQAGFSVGDGPDPSGGGATPSAPAGPDEKTTEGEKKVRKGLNRAVDGL